MQLTSAIRISRPAPEVLDALLDAGTVAACLPGSRLIGEVADNTYAGELRLRIGPMQAVYAGPCAWTTPTGMRAPPRCTRPGGSRAARAGRTPA